MSWKTWPSSPNLWLFDFREMVSNRDPYCFLVDFWHFVTMCLPTSPGTGPTQALVGRQVLIPRSQISSTWRSKAQITWHPCPGLRTLLRSSDAPGSTPHDSPGDGNKSDRARSGGERHGLRQAHGDPLVLKSGAVNTSVLLRLPCSRHPRVSLHCPGDWRAGQ